MAGGGSYIVDNEDDIYHSLASEEYAVLCCAASAPESLELVRTLKSSWRFRHFPVVILSHSEVESPIAYLSAGADAFLVNPSKALFVAQVTAILKNRSFAKEALSPKQSGTAGICRDDAFVLRLRNFISDNIQNPDLSVAGLSSAMHMSSSNLFKRVREVLGISPIALVNDMRLSKAKELLDMNHYEISQIVFLSGFNTHSYFSKCFKRKYKLSPTEYLMTKGESLAQK